jgi:hypothetical protein
MNFDLLKHDLKNLGKKLGFSKQINSSMQGTKGFVYNEGAIVRSKLNKEVFMVEKNIKATFFEPRRRCLLKNTKKETIILFEHELLPFETSNPKKMGLDNFNP